jgi:2-methylisocitrate lyase-like PEP mutase family enzyme/pimeloyl-ACP methyl ester carboxylesterase
MEENKPAANQHVVPTASGLISYTEQGTGPVALFVHGVLLNGYLWRHQLADLSDIRRCIAVDLLAHGDTEIAPDQDVSVTANAEMLKQFLDALHIDQVDLVGNDSGGGIAQIFAALYPERVRSLTLTDCDVHDNWPPEAFKPFLAMAVGGGLRGALDAMLSDKSIYRSPQALGPAYEHPERLSDESIEHYLRPLVSTEQRTRDLGRFLAAFDNQHTIAIEERLKTLQAPTLIVWGTDDVYFDVKWSRWLADTIPGTQNRVEFKGGRTFFPEERWAEFNKQLRAHWQAVQQGGPTVGTSRSPLYQASTRADQKRKTKDFRSFHIPGKPLVLFNIWDAGSAKTVAKAGAKAIATGSWSVANANGFADGERISLAFAIDNLHRIVGATDLPVTIDLESGYGDASQAVGETIALAIEAGAVGCNLEDSFPANGKLRQIVDQAQRIRCARQAADAAGIRFFINARTDIFFDPAPEEHDDAMVNQAIQRAHAYAQAGADGLFVPGLADITLIARLAEASPLPLNIMVGDATPPLRALAEHGVARVSHGPRPYLMAMKALEEVARNELQPTIVSAEVTNPNRRLQY